MSGCSKLARIEEDIVTSFTEYGSDDTTRLTLTLNRAYYVSWMLCCYLLHLSRLMHPYPQKARQGKYTASIATLLEPDVWRGLGLADYNLWAGEIWHILALRASRRYSTVSSCHQIPHCYEEME